MEIGRVDKHRRCGMSAPVGVLAVMDRAFGRADEAYYDGAAIGDSAAIARRDRYLKEHREVRDAVAELIAAAKAANERLIEATSYRHEDDDCGDRVCCGVIEYKDHEADCPAVRLSAALARVGGAA